MNGTKVLILFQILSFLSVVENKKINEIALRKVFCEFNPEIFANGSCKIKVVGRGKYDGFMDVDVIKPLKNITVSFRSYKFYNGYRPFVINVKLNACDILARKIFHPVSNFAVKFLERFSNINHTCPYVGHVFARNAHFIPGSFGAIVPEGRYKFVFEGTEGYPPIYLGKLELYSDVEEVDEMNEM